MLTYDYMLIALGGVSSSLLVWGIWGGRALTTASLALALLAFLGCGLMAA